MQHDKATLYLSYDGMTDPLGQSQVLPYLFGLAQAGHTIIIISAEKRQAYHQQRERIAALIQENGEGRLLWEPVLYHKSPPVLSTLWDLFAMYRQVLRLLRNYEVRMLHCRSYISALIGLRIKRSHGIPFLFDMRGFWVEERVEGGLWDLNKTIYRQVHAFFKKKEKEFFREAAAVVSLTEAGKQIIEERGWTEAPIHVIPCCADLHFFDYTRLDLEKQEIWRERLGVGPGARIMSYLGSLGTWYMLDEMMDFFAVLLKKDPDWVFLFITKDEPEPVQVAASKKGIDSSKIIVLSAARPDVPALVSLSSFSLFFIRPTFSKKASSPTKHAELLGLGIPVFCNAGIGDTDKITQETDPTLLLSEMTTEAYERAVNELPHIMSIPKDHLARVANKYYSLAHGVSRYQLIYKKILGQST
jgi:glycosyltransferase involved in cell wall biosynthesis